jgi:hypothetical protein
MNPDMVYQYPIWAVAGVVILGAMLGAMALELIARSVLPLDRQRMSNEVAAAMFSVVGVLYAVLLAFIVSLVWDGFNSAKATSYREAAAISDVWHLAAGLPPSSAEEIRADIHDYVRAVIRLEWPAQARGEFADSATAALERLQRAAASSQPSAMGEANLHAALLTAVAHLEDARSDRQLAAERTVPGIAWVVMLVGAAITIAFASFLRAPSLVMHLAMSAALAFSGALVLVLVIALNNPFRGDFRVSTEPFDRVLGRMEAQHGP